jgi:hypothetical protein
MEKVFIVGGLSKKIFPFFFKRRKKIITFARMQHLYTTFFTLLRSALTASDRDRQQVTPLLRPFGLHHTAAALMWLLAHVLHLDNTHMLCPPDPRRGQWLLREVMSGGNFGHYAPRQHQSILRRVLQGRLRQFRLLRFDFWESLWSDIAYWRAVITTIPERLRRHRLSLSDP